MFAAAAAASMMEWPEGKKKRECRNEPGASNQARVPEPQTATTQERVDAGWPSTPKAEGP